MARNLEKEGVDYELGAAMMEPDHREETGKVGVCDSHLGMMWKKQDRLGNALVLDTYMNALRKELEKSEKEIHSSASEKKGLFKKDNSAEAAQDLSKTLSQIQQGCMVCKKVDYTMGRYIDVMLYMWEKDEVFRDKFEKSKGLCLKHMQMVTDAIPKSLSAAKRGEFLSVLYDKQKKELERVQADIHKFTLKFDYRNAGEKWGSEIDAPKRAIEKLASYIEAPEENDK